MRSDTDAIRALVGGLPDPEIPVLTLGDLGILRDVEVTADGRVVITLTPTYSGCPAIDPIRQEVRDAVSAAGHDDVEIRIALAPAWTSDWIGEGARARLAEYGIAPPHRTTDHAPCALMSRPVRCPRCGSEDTREVSAFGATPCQAQHACNECLEPFDRFKTI